MEKVAQYREYVQILLNQYAKDDVSNDEVEVQLIFDTNRDHYQWMNVGWEDLNRIYRSIVHLDIKDGKIWLFPELVSRR
ncbi:MAG: XisI protein [Moorea sp. SIO1G6]|uniref:element excision factor XisI family protein n=1 Tax=Moorena sp. SIO1G6 TaxID=2607840 RepID=UPI0013BF7AEE|nr:element excision factor XisI family protein [Moorena sp. SIO1G6]NET68773.1 XisI protein [Moorena sp. SIO1G6]